VSRAAIVAAAFILSTLQAQACSNPALLGWWRFQFTEWFRSTCSIRFENNGISLTASCGGEMIPTKIEMSVLTTCRFNAKVWISKRDGTPLPENPITMSGWFDRDQKFMVGDRTGGTTYTMMQVIAYRK
jgi:hypothetical protein